MFVLSASQMNKLEDHAFKNGYQAADLMEQAAIAIFAELKNDLCQFSPQELKNPIVLLCGKGNNGGDAFITGCYLLEAGYLVLAVQPEELKNCSALCQAARKRFELKGGKVVCSFEEAPFALLILDGLFGIGFKGEVQPPYLDLIKRANRSKKPIISIDTPSGLDSSNGFVQTIAIEATKTLCLGAAKTGFFFNKGWSHVGKIQPIDLGLPFSSQIKSDYRLLTLKSASSLLPLLTRDRHKYQAGSVTALAGSFSMPGAALLACLSALKAGSGIVKLLYPEEMASLLTNSPLELIKLCYRYEDAPFAITALNEAKACFIGPGLGRESQVKALLKSVIPALNIPTVLDADALFFLAEKEFLPTANTIITPHLGEMQRLLQSSSPLEISPNLLKECQQYVEKYAVTLVLKGSPTFIFHPQQPIFISPVGDPGMATAGSGDVLTGLIASLLSQGLCCHDAAKLGVYLHGLAGEHAASILCSYSLLATDLIAYFFAAYKKLIAAKYEQEA